MLDQHSSTPNSVVRVEHADSPERVYPGRAIGLSSRVCVWLSGSSHSSVVEFLLNLQEVPVRFSTKAFVYSFDMEQSKGKTTRS